jgi:hypothetical protein
MMSGVARMEFLIAPGVTHILFDRNDYAPRRIYTDGRDWPEFSQDDTTFPGYSIGQWVDRASTGRYDAFLIETRHVRNPRTWDQSGIPMADDDEGVIKERLFLDKDKSGEIAFRRQSNWSTGAARRELWVGAWRVGFDRQPHTCAHRQADGWLSKSVYEPSAASATGRRQQPVRTALL